MIKIFSCNFHQVKLGFLESSDGLSFFIWLSSSSNPNASLGLEGVDGDLKEDSIGVTGLGCPAGTDVCRWERLHLHK